MKTNLTDDAVSVVSGGHAGVNEHLSPAVQHFIKRKAKELKSIGYSHDQVTKWLDDNCYHDMCLTNEQHGYEYSIDWMYIHIMLDEEWDNL